MLSTKKFYITAIGASAGGYQPLADLTRSFQNQFEQLRAGQEELKASQNLVLQILREKLP